MTINIEYSIGQTFKNAIVSSVSARETLTKLFGSIREQTIGKRTDVKSVKALRAAFYQLCAGGITSADGQKSIAFKTCKNVISSLFREAGLVERDTTESASKVDETRAALVAEIAAFIDSLEGCAEMSAVDKANLSAAVSRHYRDTAKESAKASK